MENQCAKLHGITIGLQELNMTLQIRLEEVEGNYTSLATNKESAEARFSQWEEEHKTRVHTLECALSEKMSLMIELNEQKTSLEESAFVYKKQVDNLKEKMEEALEAQKRSSDQIKVLTEERDVSLSSVKELKEKQEDIANCAEQKMSELREVMQRKDEQSLQNLQNLTEKCQMLENQLASLQQSRASEIESLHRELELNKTSLKQNQEEYTVLNQTFKEMKREYDSECTCRLEIENDFSHTKDALKTVERDLEKAKAHVVKLEDGEKEHKETAESLSIKLNEYKNTIHDFERKNSENEGVICENKRLREEIQRLEECLVEIRDEKRDLSAAEEKTSKLKQEFGRRLVETQKKLSQKEMELESCQKEFEDHVAKCNDQDSWRQKYEELAERISPFQEQLDAYEFEKQNLLSQNSQSQSEIDKLGQQYAKLLGHQNQKQKIRHVLKLKEENNNLKKEVAKLREQSMKQKQSMKKLEENANKATGVRRFDPSLAFQRNKVENKENTPLKTVLK